MAKYFGFEKNPDFTRVHGEFKQADKDVNTLYEKLVDVTDESVFRTTGPEGLRDPSSLFKNYREFGHYLHFAQDSSSQLVRLMEVNNQLVTQVKALVPEAWEQDEGLPEDLRGYLNRLNPVHDQLNHFVLMNWKQKTKVDILKVIKDRNIFKCTPESETIQVVIKCLFPTIYHKLDRFKNVWNL